MTLQQAVDNLIAAAQSSHGNRQYHEILAQSEQIVKAWLAAKEETYGSTSMDIKRD